MGWTKAFLLRTGEVLFYSNKTDVYFVKKTIAIKCKNNKKFNRTTYYTFGRGRHRISKLDLIRRDKPDFDKILNEFRKYEYNCEIDKQSLLNLL